jgi:hypothetical protein
LAADRISSSGEPQGVAAAQIHRVVAAVEIRVGPARFDVDRAARDVRGVASVVENGGVAATVDGCGRVGGVELDRRAIAADRLAAILDPYIHTSVAERHGLIGATHHNAAAGRCGAAIDCGARVRPGQVNDVVAAEAADGGACSAQRDRVAAVRRLGDVIARPKATTR